VLVVWTARRSSAGNSGGGVSCSQLLRHERIMAVQVCSQSSARVSRGVSAAWVVGAVWMACMDLVMGPRCVLEVQRRLLGAMCIAQVCAVASGQVARIESGRAFQPVAAHDERVGRAPVSQLAQHRRLMLGVLAADTAQPQGQDVALCGQIDACGDVDGPVRDLRVADFDGYRVDQKHRIDDHVARQPAEAALVLRRP